MAVSFASPYELEIDDLVLIPGLSADGTEEVYYWVDFRQKKVTSQRINIAEQRAAQLSKLDSVFIEPLPYGLSTTSALLPYFLHPHSFFTTQSGKVVVSFKQAPYFRVLDDGDGWLFPREVDYSRMLSSTNCEIDPDVVCYTEVSASDRYARYTGSDALFGGTIEHLNLATGEQRTVAKMPDFIRDTLHQVAYSTAGFYVGADMSLDVASNGLEEMTNGFDLDIYGSAEFPRSGIFLYDTNNGETLTQLPGTACAAHIVIDPQDPSVFYVSCHNISKWGSQVIVHGPGALERYRYQDGQLSRLGAFSDEEYFRVTSQELFLKDDKVLAAACGYPNHLYIIDTDDMSFVDRVTLFDAPIPQAPFACEKNTSAPLYLAITSDARYAVMSGATDVYVVDLECRQVIQQITFATPGTFAATAHIGFVPRKFRP